MSRGPVRIADPLARARLIGEAGERAVLEVLRGGRWIGGPQVAAAEAMAAKWMGRERALGVGSGTDALMLALQAVGVGPGDEVIVPAFTFVATAGAVAAIGATPVFADVEEDGCLSEASARRALTRRTRAVVPVHLFGQRARLPQLDLPVIDDAAQAFGASVPYPGGQLTTLSVYPTKVWGAAGDGGFILGDDPELLDRARRLGRHGQTANAEHARVGGHAGRNSGLDAVQAAWLLAQEPLLPGWLARRRAIATTYDAALPLSVRPLPRAPESPVSQYVVRSGRRDALRARLEAAGIETRVYYPRPLCDEPAFADARAEVPVARALCAEVLALPCHEALTQAEIERVVAAVRG